MKQFYFLLTILLLIHCQVFGQSLPTYVPTNGLVGWWPFNGNANDESGNGNHLTNYGAQLTTDRFGINNSCYSFNGNSNYLSRGVFGLVNCTVSIWAYTTSYPLFHPTGPPECVFFYNGFGDVAGFGLMAAHSKLLVITGGINADVTNSNFLPALNNWYNLVLVKSSNVYSLYSNGQLLSSGSEGMNPYAGLFVIGAGQTSNNQFQSYYTGKLDDIGIWNRALTPQEITNLYNASQPCQISITSQPSNQTTGVNRNVQFSVVSSDSISTYRWQSNSGFGFQDLYNAGQYSGVNTSTLHVSNNSPQNDNQLFRCIVSTQNCGSDTSDVVTLNINSSTISTGVPNKFTYQSVIRDSSGQLMTNHAMGVRMSLQRGPHMTNLYTETHQLSTNSNGLLTTIIGSGQSTLGRMDTIDWSVGMVYVKTEIDLNGGSNYSLVSTRELLSVPYALYSLNSGSSTPGPVGPQGPQGVPGPQGPAGGPMPSGGSHGQVLVNCNGILAWGGCTPLVTTSPITYLSGGTPTSGGVVSSDGGSVVTARGVVYGTSSSPTLSNSFTTNGTGTGSFTSVLSGLATLTSYYVRAYATNSVGTGYGNEVSFTTTAIPSFTCGASSVTDIDGNTYNTVQIGTQCWTQSNLKVSKYRNGDNIPTGLNNSQWSSTTSGSYAIYDNNPINDSVFGKLYNHYAVTDSRGLCPTGWHVPTHSEWNLLAMFLDSNADTICVFCEQSPIAGGALKSTITQPALGGYIFSPTSGATNSSGFTGLPGGRRHSSGGFDWINDFAFWWTSTNQSNSNAWYRNVSGGGPGGPVQYHEPRTFGRSIRCVRDLVSGGGSATAPTISTTTATSVTTTGATTGGNVTSNGGASITARGVAYGMAQNPTISGTITNNGTGTGVFTSTLTGLTASTVYYVRAYATNSVGTSYGNEVSFSTDSFPVLRCQGAPTVTDIDGNTYNTVQIGSQCWTQSNLKVSKYRNGDNIPTGLSNTDWENTTSGAYAIYNNDSVNDGLYGKLYNHYAVTDSRGLCPTGWHVPTDGEWNLLVKYLHPNADTVCGGCWQSSTAGGALKSTAMQPTPGGWNPPNGGATNSSGFTALPGGLRNYNGDFYYLTYVGYWWSSSVFSGSSAWYRALYYDYSYISRTNYTRTSGFSVRCCRD